jgi:uncharacterized protein YbjT (DUF2867 family)
MNTANIFITGGTGYIGRGLIPLLIDRGHLVRVLVRRGSESKLPSGCTPVIGNALDKQSFVNSILPSDTVVQLVGVAHPGPAKSNEFRSIDLVSGRASIEAAAEVGIKHFVYVSVAQPAPIMKTYQSVRAECEKYIHDKELNATILRPWYVLGQGHRWPIVLQPAYWLLERLPSTTESARRLGLVTLQQMLVALVSAIEHPSDGIRIVEVPQIKSSSL